MNKMFIFVKTVKCTRFVLSLNRTCCGSWFEKKRKVCRIYNSLDQEQRKGVCDNVNERLNTGMPRGFNYHKHSNANENI